MPIDDMCKKDRSVKGMEDHKEARGGGGGAHAAHVGIDHHWSRCWLLRLFYHISDITKRL